MRILHVTDAAAAGVLASVTALARAQAATPGVEAVRFCYTPRPESPSHAVIVARLGPAVDVSRWAATPSRAGVGLVRGLVRELRRGEADIIHLHSSRAGFLGRLLAAACGTRARIVYSPHGFAFNRRDFAAPLALGSLALERLALVGGRDIIVVSDSEAEVAAKLLPRARTRVLPNTVDLAAFAPAGRTEQDRLGVVHLGRITAQKRPDEFAAIAAEANRLHPGLFRFMWIGDGDRNLLAAEPGNEGADPADPTPVTVSGWVGPDEIRAHLSRSAILLFTSAGEGMPVSLLEAQAMGLPTVGADVVGVRDLVADGVEGRLFRTVTEAVGALGWMLEADHLSACGKAARRRVERDHDQAGLGPTSLAVYLGVGSVRSLRLPLAETSPLEYNTPPRTEVPCTRKAGHHER